MPVWLRNNSTADRTRRPCAPLSAGRWAVPSWNAASCRLALVEGANRTRHCDAAAWQPEAGAFDPSFPGEARIDPSPGINW